jgi:flavodoxin
MNKSIVVYYTLSGRAKRMAEIIASQTGADMLEVLPETPYTQNYNMVAAQAKDEIRREYHPPFQKAKCDLSLYDVIYIGTPIWWGTMAPPIATFLSENDFSGKTIMPFTTHGGGGKGHLDRDIAKMCSGVKVMDMYTAYEGGGRSAEGEIAAWIKLNNLDK